MRDGDNGDLRSLMEAGRYRDLKSTGAQAPWGFESLALRHSSSSLASTAAFPIVRQCALLCPFSFSDGDAEMAASFAAASRRSASFTMAYRR